MANEYMHTNKQNHSYRENQTTNLENLIFKEKLKTKNKFNNKTKTREQERDRGEYQPFDLICSKLCC